MLLLWTSLNLRDATCFCMHDLSNLYVIYLSIKSIQLSILSIYLFIICFVIVRNIDDWVKCGSHHVLLYCIVHWLWMVLCRALYRMWSDVHYDTKTKGMHSNVFTFEKKLPNHWLFTSQNSKVFFRTLAYLLVS